MRRAAEGLPRWRPAASEGTRLELTSVSRLGRIDLGQNPRNLEELLRAVEREVGVSGASPRG